MTKKWLETDNLALTSNSKIDLARLPPSFRNLLPHIYRVNHGLAFYQRADEPFIEAPNTVLMATSKVGSKTKITFWN